MSFYFSSIKKLKKAFFWLVFTFIPWPYFQLNFWESQSEYIFEQTHPFHLACLLSVKDQLLFIFLYSLHFKLTWIKTCQRYRELTKCEYLRNQTVNKKFFLHILEHYIIWSLNMQIWVSLSAKITTGL